MKVSKETLITRDNVLQVLGKLEKETEAEKRAEGIRYNTRLDRMRTDFHNWFVGHKYWREFLWIVQGKDKKDVKFYRGLKAQKTLFGFSIAESPGITVYPLHYDEEKGTVSLWVHVPGSSKQVKTTTDSFMTQDFFAGDLKLIDYLGRSEGRGEFIDNEVTELLIEKERLKIKIENLRGEKERILHGA